MNYCNIKNCDVADGIGVRVSLFVSGCTNKCKNCFQPETWDFNYGEEFTEEVEDKIINMVNKSYIDGLTILGGDPMEPRNQPSVLKFLKRFREKLPEKSVWVFTGFTYERLMNIDDYCHTEFTEEILKNIDILVDGRFVEELKDLSLRFRGSSNQRIIDVKKTMESGTVVIAPYSDRKFK